MMSTSNDLRDWANDPTASNIVPVSPETLRCVAARLDAKDAEIAALRLDAERYRWLSLQDLTYLSLGYIVDREHDGEYCVDLLDDTFYGETLGAAIDKAIAQAVQA